MEYLWMIAGGIIGWILVEFVAALSKIPMPLAFNFGLLLVGALTGYTLSA